MNKLYIIGNGFDLHHGLDTKYSSFGKHLNKYYSEIYEHLLEYYGIPDVVTHENDQLWRDFEHSLSLLDSETVYEVFSGSLANPAGDGFSDRDWGTFAIEIERIVQNLTTNLIRAFHEFIQKVDYSNAPKLVNLDRQCVFLNFNYTKTLEHFYKINPNNILYIHGRAGDTDDIILGHGVDPDNFVHKDPQPPSGLSDKKLEQWQECMADQFDHSFELGRQEMEHYFLKSFKDTDQVISRNRNFFVGLKDIEDIFILGHSLSDVDYSYFEQVSKNVRPKANWTVTFYSRAEKQSHLNTIKRLGVLESQIKMIKLTNL